MRHLLLAFMLMTVGAHAGEPIKRLHAIEMKFGLNYDHSEKRTWVFRFPGGVFGPVPIVMPANATDHDVVIALQASLNCAVFYERMIKELSGQKSLDSVSYAF